MTISGASLTTLLFVITLVAEVGQIIWLPLWLESIDSTTYWSSSAMTTTPAKGSGSYTVSLAASVFFFLFSWLFYVIFANRARLENTKTVVAVAIMNGAGSFFTAYVSCSNRTSPTIQAILLNSYVPITVLTRFFMVRKMPSLTKSICVIFVCLGLCLSTVPDLFPDAFGEVVKDSGQKGKYTILWMLLYVFFAVVPDIFTNVLAEKALKRWNEGSIINEAEFEQRKSDRVSYLLYVCMLMGMAQLIFSLALFWVDFIPTFGFSQNPTHFITLVQGSLACSIAMAGCSNQTIGFAVGYIASMLVSTISSNLIILFGEGSTPVALLMNLVTPFAVLFWILFSYGPPLQWMPHFDKSKYCVMVGVVLILPSVIVYNCSPGELSYRWKKTNKKIFNISLYSIEIVPNI